MIDLHTHSTFSDGTVSPAGVIALAEEAGLTAVALCDHNTVGGLPGFLAAAEGRRIRAVPGIEFSTDYGETELHMLGLFIRPEHYEATQALVDTMLQRKEQSNRELVRALNGAGMALDYEHIKASTAGGLVNRAVIAGEMTRLGCTSSVKEAFSLWLSPKRGYFKPPRRLDVFEVIRFIRSVGAVAVLAHPFLNLDEAGLRAFLPRAIGEGLDGMETRYPLFSPEETALAEQIAAEFGLLQSGGSDFHGENKPDIQVGAGRGGLRVPDEFLTQLDKRRRIYQGAAAEEG